MDVTLRDGDQLVAISRIAPSSPQAYVWVRRDGVLTLASLGDDLEHAALVLASLREA